MGILSIYDEVINNPKPITEDYFETRPKANGLATWYSYDETTPLGELNTLEYTTYKIPIIKKHTPERRCCSDSFDLPYFVSVWEDQPIQVATIKFTYNFSDKVLFYDIERSKLYAIRTSADILMFCRDQFRDICDELEVDLKDIKPGRLYKDVVSIQDFELIIDGIKSQLTGMGFYLPNF